MIIATGAYEGNYIDNISSGNVVEYCTNINLDPTQNQSRRN